MDLERSAQETQIAAQRLPGNGDADWESTDSSRLLDRNQDRRFGHGHGLHQACEGQSYACVDTRIDRPKFRYEVYRNPLQGFDSSGNTLGPKYLSS